jgi:hypothetical protein
MTKEKPNFLTTETRRAQAAAMRGDRDNTRAILLYMIDRGAFAGMDVEVTSDTPFWVHTYDCNVHGIAARIEHGIIPGETWKQRRPCAIAIYEARDRYTTDKRGRRCYEGRAFELVGSAPIPHWDAYPAPVGEMDLAA